MNTERLPTTERLLAQGLTSFTLKSTYGRDNHTNLGLTPGHMCICARSRVRVGYGAIVMCVWVTNVSLVIGDSIIHML